MKAKNQLKVLLLQIRDEASVRREELESFAQHSGLEVEQITIHNVFDHPHFNPDIINGYDALFIGGASEASVLEEEHYPFLQSGYRLIHHCVESSIPTFASCFGFQMAIMAFGGEILRDLVHYEMGTCSIDQMPAGKKDPLFQHIPSSFKAVSVHQEKALDLPPNCELLAHTEECCHAFRVKNKPFWGFQFHPELNREKLIERLNVFKEKYTDDQDHYQNVIADLDETPHSNRLLKIFVEEVLLK